MKDIKPVLISIISIALLFSCRKWDDFKKYIDEGETLYTGKMDSVKIYSGKGRVQLYGLLKADPKVNKFVVSWNNGADSVVYDWAKSAAGIDTVRKTFAVDEGVKSFRIVTYDVAGNKSVDVYAVGTSYGETFRKRLSNRNILSTDFTTTGTTINWDQMDMTVGPQYTEVVYTDAAGQSKTVNTPVSLSQSVLNGMTVSGNIQYRTIFRPDTTSIDTFTTAYQTRYIKVVPPLKNRKVPFIASSTDGGRWGNLADWQSNTAVRNHNGYGGWDQWNDNIFNVESGWGSPAITNGKIWQTFMLDPGSYTFEISDLRDTNLGAADGAYLVVASGSGLPDVASIGTAIGSAKIESGKPLSALKVVFTLAAQTQVSMGYLTTQPAGDPGRYCNIRAFNFYAN